MLKNSDNEIIFFMYENEYLKIKNNYYNLNKGTQNLIH